MKSAQAEQWCTRLDSGPANWAEEREAPRHYMGGRTQGPLHRPAEPAEEWREHGCLGAYGRSPFVQSVERCVRRGDRANRLYEQADEHMIELVHYYERHLDGVRALGSEMANRG